MKIGLCCDDNFAMPCGVCMLSILENNDPSEIEFFILCDKVSKESKRKLVSTAQSRGAFIKLIDVEDSLFDNLKVSPHFPKSIYYRYLFPDILREEEKLLYLDCDILVRGSLTDLWNVDLFGYSCGVIQDQAADDIRIYNRLQIPKDSKYFNSGVILFNLEYWRLNNIMEKCIGFISDYPDKCVYPDQDALNVILLGAVRHLSFGYNFQTELLKDESELILDRSVWNNVKESKVNPVIFHFTGRCKPWHKECDYLYGEEWDGLLKRSLWSKYKKKSIYRSSWRFKILEFIAPGIVRRYRKLCK